MIGSIDENDSQPIRGGRIPGLPGAAAFTLNAPTASEIPVIIAVPHAGRSYPPGLLRDFRHAGPIVLRLEDRLADMLGQGVAANTGASLLIAHAPRALVDLNRSVDDIDWEMFTRDARPEGGLPLASRRARSGLGLVPRRLPSFGELWKRKLDAHDLSDRVDGIHAPYHAALGQALAEMRARWGAALLIDLHSMPPLAPPNGVPGAQVVIGDRFGASCHSSIIADTLLHFAQCDREVAHNRPYAGGYVLERHADVRNNIHAMQIEIDRSRYLDDAMVEPGETIGAVIEDLSGLVRRLGAVVGELGGGSGNRDTALAAE